MSTITLRKIIEEPILLKGFSSFCKIHHASENLEFWLAAEQFHEQFRGDDPAASSISPSSKRSVRMAFWGLSRSSRALDQQVDAQMTQATKIFEAFLAQNAEQWVCIEQGDQQEIKRRLEEGSVDHTLFDAVQKKVFENMEKDLLPRFAKSFEEESVFFDISSGQAVPQSPLRGSVRYVPDQKLRKHVSKTSE